MIGKWKARSIGTQEGRDGHTGNLGVPCTVGEGSFDAARKAALVDIKSMGDLPIQKRFDEPEDRADLQRAIAELSDPTEREIVVHYAQWDWKVTPDNEAESTPRKKGWFW